MARFIIRKDGKKWRVWDRQQGKWRGKGHDSFTEACRQHEARLKRQKT